MKDIFEMLETISKNVEYNIETLEKHLQKEKDEVQRLLRIIKKLRREEDE